MGNIKLQIPWTKLTSGGLRTSADNISLVFRLHPKVSDDSFDSSDAEAPLLEKMVCSFLILPLLSFIRYYLSLDIVVICHWGSNSFNCFFIALFATESQCFAVSFCFFSHS